MSTAWLVLTHHALRPAGPAIGSSSVLEVEVEMQQEAKLFEEVQAQFNLLTLIIFIIIEHTDHNFSLIIDCSDDHYVAEKLDVLLTMKYSSISLSIYLSLYLCSHAHTHTSDMSNYRVVGLTSTD